MQIRADLTEEFVGRMRRRSRALLLLDAAERAGATPLSSRRMHAFAYLSDVLSPVWGLPPFDGKILKIEGGPYYPDLQDELDQLAIDGLIDVADLHYEKRGKAGARLEGNYSLRFESPHLEPILAALGARVESDAWDPRDYILHNFLVELAGALATVPNDEIDRAASIDVTYRTEQSFNNIIDFAAWADDPWVANPSWRAAERFRTFMPQRAHLAPGEKLYLYASYLGQFVNAA
jgi:hypothetical protein